MSLSHRRNQPEENQDVVHFLAQLEHIPWFANVGKPVGPNPAVQQISSWDKCPGPEEPSVTDLHSHQQLLYDEIMRSPDQEREVLSELWDRIQGVVLRAASRNIPYDPN